MFGFSALIILLLSNNCYGMNYYQTPFNYNGHAYYFSSVDGYVNNVYLNCHSAFNYYYYYYVVEIQDQKENDVLASLTNKDRTIGAWRYGPKSDLFITYGNYYEAITYSNFDPDIPKPYFLRGVIMMASSGKWRVTNIYDEKYWICEIDRIASYGINVTYGRQINIPYNSMVTFRGHTYYIYKAARDYATAKRICKYDHNGYIFIPNDGTENCAIHELVFSRSFVGITRHGNNSYMTEKNYLASYLPWASLDLIDKECVVRDYINGELFTIDCSESTDIICESDSVIKGATPKDCSEENKFHYFSQIFYFQNNSFYVFDFLATREEAVSVCAMRSAVLYAPFNPAENCAVFENVEFDIGINFGSIYIDGLLMRGDKLKSNFTNWDKGYPVEPENYGCVYAQYASGKWKNDKCYNTRFICYKNDDNYNYSNINCTNNFWHLENETVSVKIYSKIYTMFGRSLSYHDSSRLCSQFGLSMVKTTDKNIVNKLNKKIKNQRFFMDFRILWNDTTLTWIGDKPDSTAWAPNEPTYNDDGIVCITVAQNGSWVATRCREEHLAVCVGYHSPYFASSLSGSSKKSIALGVGIFFGIVAFIAVALGLFIYIRKNPTAFNISALFANLDIRRKPR